MSALAYAALWIFVFSVPWERLVLLPGLSITTRATGALALGLTLLLVVVSGRLRRWRGFQAAALLFVIWAGIGVLVLHLREVPNKFYTFVQLFLVIWMVWELAPAPRRLIGILLAYVLGSYVAAGETILLYRRAGEALRRFAAGGSDPNSLAMTLALSLPMAWYLATSHPRPAVRWVCRVYIPIGLLAIALTGSRGGMIASMVALLVIPLTISNLSPGKLVLAIAMLAISGALAVSYVPDKVVDRLATTGASVEDMSLGGRFRLWKAGMHAFTERPIMGYGTSAFKQAINPELGALTQVAHNSYLSVLVEEGIVGLMLYLSMMLSVALAVFSLPRLERRFALVLFTTLTVAMLPLSWEDQKPVWIVLAVLVGFSNVQAAALGRVVQQPLQPRPVRVPPASVAARLRQRSRPVGGDLGRGTST
jgi:O-antigen ligase